MRKGGREQRVKRGGRESEGSDKQKRNRIRTDRQRDKKQCGKGAHEVVLTVNVYLNTTSLILHSKQNLILTIFSQELVQHCTERNKNDDAWNDDLVVRLGFHFFVRVWERAAIHCKKDVCIN